MRRVLAHDPDQLQFVLDIRSAERDRGNLWVVSTRLQKFLRRTLNSNEINLRIMKVTGPPQLPPPAPYSNLLHYKKWLTPQKRDFEFRWLTNIVMYLNWVLSFYTFLGKEILISMAYNSVQKCNHLKKRRYLSYKLFKY